MFFNTLSSTTLAAGRRALSTHTPRQFFVGGNFKCNGSKQFVQDYVSQLNQVDFKTTEVVVAPPSVYLDTFKQLAKDELQVSAQDCWTQGPGAFTGETCVEMLKDIDIPWTIVGHSERRGNGEDDDTVAAKAAHALNSDVKVIACCGEHLDERESGETMNVLAKQMEAYVAQVKSVLGNDPAAWGERFVVAYEPIWAIGTGVTASPEQAQDTHNELREWFKVNVSPQVADSLRILYGGSVNAKVCDSLAAKPDVDGFLVGGASLKPDEFTTIINAGSK